jgi:hypothetical protein
MRRSSYSANAFASENRKGMVNVCELGRKSGTLGSKSGDDG